MRRLLSHLHNPLSQKDSAKSELAEARDKRAREFRFPARSAGRFGRGLAPATGLVALPFAEASPLPDRMVRGAGFEPATPCV